MKRKVMWITFWTTMAYWLAGFWGCASSGAGEQNYKLLDDDQPMMQQEDPSGPGASTQGAERLIVTPPADDPALVSTPAPEHAEDPRPSEVAATAPEAAPATAPWSPDAPTLTDPQPAHSAVLIPADQPSLVGLDRTHWPRTVVGPANGKTHHFPVYFHDLRLGDEATESPSDAAPLSTQYGHALNGRYHHGRGYAGVVQPAKFFFDLVLLVPKQVVKPFFLPVTTP